MEFYKETNFKETPIGKIPNEWGIVKLGDREIAQIRGAKKVEGFHKVAFISMELISNSRIYTQYKIRDIKDVKSYTYCEAGDLLLPKITPCFENGKQGVVPFDIPNGFALATTEVFPIVCQGIDRLFLFYILKFSKFRKILEFSMRGTTGRQRVPKDAVERLKIPLPPIEEQQKIVEVLSVVDLAIQKTDEIIAKTERLKKGLMQTLLTKGIGHKEFKQTPIGKIPKTWKVVKLGEVLTDVKYGTSVKSNKDGIGVPILGIPNVLRGEIDKSNLRYVKLSKKEQESLTLKSGDILLVRTNANPEYIGRCALFEEKKGTWVYASYLIRIRVDEEKVTPEYLVKYLQSEKARKQFLSIARTSAGNYNINTKGIRSIIVCLPPIPEQQKIANILLTIDKKLKLERKRKEKLERIKKGMMNLLLTGKVRVGGI